MDLSSQNTSREQNFASLIIPSPRSSIVLAVIALSLLLLVNMKNIVFALTKDGGVYGTNVREELLVRPEAINKLFSAPLLATIVPFILWLTIGAISYAVVWSCISYFSRVHDDIKLTGFRHPSDFKRSNYWGSLAGRYLLLGCLLVVCFGYLLVAIGQLLPRIITLFGTGLVGLPQPRNILDIFLGWAAMTVCLYIGILLVRITLNAWHTYIH